MAVVKSPKNNKRKTLWIKAFSKKNKINLVSNNFNISNNYTPKKHLKWVRILDKKQFLLEYLTFFTEDSHANNITNIQTTDNLNIESRDTSYEEK